MPSMPRKTSPTKDINGINELSPNKKSTNGTKQVKSQAGNSLRPISYIKIFFNKSPIAIKAIKVLTKPIERATGYINPKWASPVSAESVVLLHEIPNIKK